MDKTGQTFQISEIISRYILGNMTDLENEQLKEWLEKSPSHQQVFESLVHEQKQLEKLQAYERISWDAPLSDLLVYKKRMDQIRRRKRVIRVMKYAAILVLPLAITFYLLTRAEHPVIHSSQMEARVIPAGKPKATLQLASGEKVILTAEATQRIEQENGVFIKQDSGIIKYRVDDTKVKKVEQFNTITVPRGAEFALMLSDGTRVWLNAETRLRYPVEFVGNERKVYLEGEAFFEVTHDEQKEFIVETKKAKVKVYGTAFNVSAYEDEEETTATLVCGSIGMKIRNSDEKIRLKPGEQACLIDNKLTKKEVDVELYTAWREGRMVFKSVRLEELLHHLSRWYDVKIVFMKDQLKNVLFTGEVAKYEDFSEVLDVIETTQAVHFQIKDQTIIVY